MTMREDRPVPLCWRTRAQRQQSGKRQTLDRHLYVERLRCWRLVSEILVIFFIFIFFIYEEFAIGHYIRVCSSLESRRRLNLEKRNDCFSFIACSYTGPFASWEKLPTAYKVYQFDEIFWFLDLFLFDFLFIF